MIASQRVAVPRSQRIAVFLIEDVRLYAYAIAFVAVVLLTAAAYHTLPAGHGIQRDGCENLEFGDALYFSLVTISSLGYGDIHPLGFSRGIACAEVLFGLFMVGIIIAKATSFRLAYHVQRLFSSSIHERLQDFSYEFEKLHLEMKTVANLASTAFDVPNERAERDQPLARERFTQAIDALQAQSSSIAEYIAVEIDYGRFFSLAPPKTAKRMADAMDELFFYVADMIPAMSPTARQTLLDGGNRMRLLKALQRQEELHDIVDQHCPQGEVRDSFMKLRATCKAMPDRYFAVPMVRPDQPDLQIPVDEPEVKPV